MEYVHLLYRFVLTDLAEVDLGCLRILMAQDYF
jgi:hypothetical protein